MPKSPIDNIEMDILYAALRAPFGLAITTDNVHLTTSRLNAAKQQDAAFVSIRIFPSRTDPFGELWIVNATKETKNG